MVIQKPFYRGSANFANNGSYEEVKAKLTTEVSSVIPPLGPYLGPSLDNNCARYVKTNDTQNVTFNLNIDHFQTTNRTENSGSPTYTETKAGSIFCSFIITVQRVDSTHVPYLLYRSIRGLKRC